MDDIQTAWAAGLFEGEGTIVWNKTNEAPALRLAMSDQDTVEKFRAIVGTGSVWGPYQQSKYPNGKPMFMWSLSNFKDITELMERLSPHLSARRLARWDELVGMYHASTKKRRPDGARTRKN